MSRYDATVHGLARSCLAIPGDEQQQGGCQQAHQFPSGPFSRRPAARAKSSGTADRYQNVEEGPVAQICSQVRDERPDVLALRVPPDQGVHSKAVAIMRNSA